MNCISPVLIHYVTAATPDGVVVPCGKCLACKIAKRSEWSLRVLHESDYYDEICFITLTYDDEHIPKDGSISKRDLQLFFKRLRKATGIKLRYYASGEYGEQNFRCHYHAILFGIGFKSHKLDLRTGHIIDGPIKDCWDKGIVHMGTVTPESITYVASYVDKKLYGDLARQVYSSHGLTQPFQLVSQGLGRKFCDDNKDMLKENKKTTLRGVIKPLPRYYKKRLGLSVVDYKDYVDSKFIESQIKIVNKNLLNIDDRRKYFDDIRKAKLADLKGKLKIGNLRKKNKKNLTL